MAASFQEAVVDVLVAKARRAAQEIGAKGLCLGGGVAANSLLRERFLDACEEDGLRAFVPSRAMCTDNAAMVAAAGWWKLQAEGPSPMDTGAVAGLALPYLTLGATCASVRRALMALAGAPRTVSRAPVGPGRGRCRPARR